MAEYSAGSSHRLLTDFFQYFVDHEIHFIELHWIIDYTFSGA